jgi:signal transduction histidine kinase
LLIDDQDLERFNDALQENPDSPGEVTVRVRMKHGPGKWVQWHVRPLAERSDSSGRSLCLGYELPAEEPAAASVKPAPKAVRQRRLAESILHAQHQERARIGQELHDNINQILTSAHLYIDCLRQDSEDFDYVKGKAMEIILHAVEEVRHLSREMTLPDFERKGLVCSIKELINELSYNNRLEIQFNHADMVTIESQDQQLKLTLFRILQAQIRNIIKHSGASQVEISLHANNEQVRLGIRDNGLGFDLGTTKYGLGLAGIYERTGLYNGRVNLDTAPGRGCSLIITIPLELRRI